MKRKWWIILDAVFLTVLAGLILSPWPESPPKAPQSVAPVVKQEKVPDLPVITLPVEPTVEPTIEPMVEPTVESAELAPPTAEPALTSQQSRPLLTPYKLPGQPRLWRVR